MSLSVEFENLATSVEQLVALLEEADERFWIAYLNRGLRDIRARRLAGATSVLGCFGGQDTLSDLQIALALKDSAPLQHRNLNARLTHLRTQVFEQADLIASRRSW